MKIKPVQMLLPLKYPKKKAVQLTFRFSVNTPNKPQPVPGTKFNAKGSKLDKFL